MTRYYLICDSVVGKEVDGKYFIFENGWRPDTRWMLFGRLMGYDPYEPPDSPYAVGNMSVMDEVRPITYAEAKEILGDLV